MAGELAGRGLAVPPGTLPQVGLENSGTFGVNPVPVPTGYMLVVRFNAGFSATLTGLFVDGKTSDNAFTGVLYATKRYRRPITGGGYLSVLASAADANIAWDIVPDASVPPFDNMTASGGVAPSVLISPGDQSAVTLAATFKMVGLGNDATPCVFTPQLTGKVKFTLVCHVNTSVAADGLRLKLMQGTGAAPANSAGVTGTIMMTNDVTMTASVANSDYFPLTLVGFASGLAIGTQIWLDLAVAWVTTGGTCTVQKNTCIVEELAA